MEHSVATPIKLLLIEDDQALAQLIVDYLQEQHYQVLHFTSIEESLRLANRQAIDLIICDVMLPGVNGFQGIARLTSHFACPLLFLSALSSQREQIMGLELGACDYITKPVDPSLLLAKIKANLRKTKATSNPTLLLGDIEFNRQRRSMHYQQQVCEFTHKEFALLWMLVLHCNQVLSREYLFEQTVGRRYDGLDRTIDLKISRLRKKLEQAAIPQLELMTVYGQGYSLIYNSRGMP
ncbi:response regulator transcription factor [Pseudidiomarina sp. PP-1MA]|uniref:Response regulator transcription factor n=1 Tax=Pseudidiomarina sp. PP-1MA TaxID=3237706 RepID=A0AB39X8A9_9GAMM